MSVDPSFALVGSLIGVPARANMVAALMDGRAQTASELAFAAGVTPQTASSHLAKLTDAGLLAVERQGRHRYYRLAGPAVADALEPLSHLAPATRAPERRSAQLRRVGELRTARFCYDHLAGRLGVALTDSLLQRRFLRRDEGDFRLGPKGRAFLEGLGLDVAAAEGERRHFARCCLDWSERRPHLGGALGAALADHLVRRKWLRRDRTPRKAVVTALGERELERLFPGLVAALRVAD
ncbi:MAG TPA: winged helix-turn-helix domain-containing protein [Kiloniellaceae bacterium]|nr:winged helix-turn-helix domain-containing protein [Kiloniellaceae bacterium]